ncbi:hypothetical protein DENSPDRAFT_675656 [Dentipellis sp. KUC8613]|nr:hypothetical protein DENSPDRAFT_675656 [Dentipellis sp. KUC8613]
MSSNTSDTLPRTNSTFNYLDGDTILRSSDGVQFRVHNIILRMASPVFDEALSLPKPAPKTNVDEDETPQQDNAQVVYVAEDEKTLATMLSFCYPGPPPSLGTLKDAKQALTVAQKYEMDTLDDFFKQKLLAFAEQHPEQVFAIGWAQRWKDVVMVAAKATLRKPFLTGAVVDEFDDIPASAAWKLLAYQRECIRRCGALADSWRIWVTLEDAPRPLGVKAAPRSHIPESPCSCPDSVRITGSDPYNDRTHPDLMVSRHFVALMGAIVDAVKGAPHPSTVTSLAVIGQSLVSTPSCADCREGAVRAVEGFTTRFAERIDGIISKASVLAMLKGLPRPLAHFYLVRLTSLRPSE